jgi:hypothetical protein
MLAARTLGESVRPPPSTFPDGDESRAAPRLVDTEEKMLGPDTRVALE